MGWTPPPVAQLVAHGHRGPIYLVITDLVMPRMGGLQFVDQRTDR